MHHHVIYDETDYEHIISNQDYSSIHFEVKKRMILMMIVTMMMNILPKEEGL